MRKSNASGIRRRRRPVLLSLVCLAVLGLASLAVFSDGPSPSYANANCGSQNLGGHWVNTGTIAGPAVTAATISMPCAAAVTPAPAVADVKTAPARIDVSLTVRCLYVLSCDWTSVQATQSDAASRGSRLTARYDQQNFDREVSIEPIDANHLRLKMTSRFKGLGLGSVEATYTLERAKG